MKEYTNALAFWNNWVSNIQPQRVDTAQVGSETLDNALKTLSSCGTILDFGCGAGWASISMALSGAKRIIAVDQSENMVNFTLKSAELSGCTDVVKAVSASENFLFSYPEHSVDGIFTSNVLDVVPTDVSRKMLSGFSRVLSPKGKIVVMLNFYLTPEYVAEKKLTNVKENYFVIDGNLRIVNFTNAQWADIFAEYFHVDSIEEFVFDGEKPDKPRRLFMLSNKV